MRYLLPRIEQLPIWIIISAPVFMALFIGLIWWTYKKDRKKIYKEIERMPLEDDTNGNS